MNGDVLKTSFWIKGYKVNVVLTMLLNSVSGVKCHWDRLPRLVGKKFYAQYRDERDAAIKTLLNVALFRFKEKELSVLVLDDLEADIVMTVIFSGDTDRKVFDTEGFGIQNCHTITAAR
jgi:hypothetical protein